MNLLFTPILSCDIISNKFGLFNGISSQVIYFFERQMTFPIIGTGVNLSGKVIAVYFIQYYSISVSIFTHEDAVRFTMTFPINFTEKNV